MYSKYWRMQRINPLLWLQQVYIISYTEIISMTKNVQKFGRGLINSFSRYLYVCQCEMNVSEIHGNAENVFSLLLLVVAWIQINMYVQHGHIARSSVCT